MGLRFRKSIKLGKGVKLNLGKKGIGLSIGGKGARYSINSSGRSTTTVGIPGTGLSYSHTSGGKKKRKSSSSKSTNRESNSYAAPRPKPPMKTGVGMMVLTICLGFTGIQWFVSGRWGMGFLYFFTGGLFLIGWIVDIIRQVASYIKSKNEGQI